MSGRSVGTFFREEVAEPLGLHFWIGLPATVEPRVAPLLGGLDPRAASDDGDGEGDGSPPMTDEVRQMIDSFMGPDTMLGKSLFAPGGALAGNVWNLPELRAAEIPAANGVADARSIARMYAAVIGEVDGVRLLHEGQLAEATRQRTSGPNKVLLDFDIQFGLGFMLRSSLLALGGPRSFGHFGAGGSVGWADPEAELSFGYVMNRMDLGLAGDLRSFSLINACYDATA
jgi:CubicO group peptidase (beta-lactamase class C family)